MSEVEAALYEAPFAHVLELVKPARDKNNRDDLRLNWWRHDRSGQRLFDRLPTLARYIASPRVAKHRIFVWIDSRICPDGQLVVIARDGRNDLRHPAQPVSRGVVAAARNQPGRPAALHADHHFRDLPLPGRPHPRHSRRGLCGRSPRRRHRRGRAAVGRASRPLAQSSEWVEWADEPVSGYPKRPVARDAAAAKQLKAAR